MPVSRVADHIGRVLSGRYRILAPIGSGASAHVYLADDITLRRQVAIKLLHGALADDDKFLRRFRAEAQSVAQLSHPNIVSVYDWGEDDTGPWLVLEALRGGSLRDLLDAENLLTPSQALVVGLEGARALDHAHRRGFVHRDIKPANLLFDDDGHLRVADFGLARALAEAAVTEPIGTVLGTARYVSPEQVQGSPLEGASDVYSLALVLIEAVTGTVPFASDNNIGSLLARVSTVVTVPAAMGALRPVIERATTIDPAQRSDAATFARQLIAIANTLPAPGPMPLVGNAKPKDASIVDVRDATEIGIVGPAKAAMAAPVIIEDTPVVVGTRPSRLRRLAARAGIRRRATASTPTDAPAVAPRVWLWRTVRIVLAIAIGIGVAFPIRQLTLPSVIVPDLSTAALADMPGLVNFDLRIEIVGQEYSESIVAGAFVSQRPEPGTSLRGGGTISLTTSLGPEPRSLSVDPIGRLYSEVEAELLNLGLQVALPATVFDELKVPNEIVALDPNPFVAPVARGTVVTITYVVGPEPRLIPDVSAMPIEQAQAALSALRLVPAVREEFSDDVPVGQIIGTTPAAGTTQGRDQTVTILVSKGPDTVAVPNVIGKNQSEARASLEAVGLKVGSVFGPSGNNKQVINAIPGVGATLKRGSAVNLYVA